MGCSAQHKALVSVVFRSAKAYGVARFSGLTLVGELCSIGMAMSS
jgi:hypothetical protein